MHTKETITIIILKLIISSTDLVETQKITAFYSCMNISLWFSFSKFAKIKFIKDRKHVCLSKNIIAFFLCNCVLISRLLKIGLEL